MKVGKEAVTAVAARKEFKLYDSLIDFIGVGAARGDEWVWSGEGHVLGFKVYKRIKLGGFSNKFGFPVLMNILLDQVFEGFLCWWRIKQ